MSPFAISATGPTSDWFLSLVCLHSSSRLIHAIRDNDEFGVAGRTALDREFDRTIEEELEGLDEELEGRGKKSAGRVSLRRIYSY